MLFSFDEALVYKSNSDSKIRCLLVLNVNGTLKVKPNCNRSFLLSADLNVKSNCKKISIQC